MLSWHRGRQNKFDFKVSSATVLGKTSDPNQNCYVKEQYLLVLFEQISAFLNFYMKKSTLYIMTPHMTTIQKWLDYRVLFADEILEKKSNHNQNIV